MTWSSLTTIDRIEDRGEGREIITITKTGKKAKEDRGSKFELSLFRNYNGGQVVRK